MSSSRQVASSSGLTEYQLMQQKREEQKAKTRARMARRAGILYSQFASLMRFRYRLKLKQASAEEQEEAQTRARAARARYRERNRTQLLYAAKCKRIVEFTTKYGQAAYDEKTEDRRRRREERQTRPRRNLKVRPAKPKSSSPRKLSTERKTEVSSRSSHILDYDSSYYD
ncbi:hypothetical protein C8R43DRAFT_1141085 [Mycena crocata]|nr:hypothetical protein C8R43DRAFT_1141085 [Mycena crocata]